MIDKIVLRCNFSGDWRDFRLADLGIPLEGSLDRDGHLYALRHKWESIPSSFSGLAFKVFFFPTFEDPQPWIEIKASPAKLRQGHNVYGSDDLAECAMILIEVLCNQYPCVVDRLDIQTWRVVEVDITYSSWANDARFATSFIDSLSHVSHGQTKARSGYHGTVYFGQKNSRIKKIKVYDKLRELQQRIKEAETAKDDKMIAIHTQQLLEWATGMVRWEVTLKTRWFERREIPTQLKDMVQKWEPQQYWMEAMGDILSALEGRNMKTIKDTDVLDLLKQRHFKVTKSGEISYAAALAAYRTYRAIQQDGWEVVKSTMTKPSFYRHVKMLSDIEIPRASLQVQQGEGFTNVVPLVRYATVDFGVQWPQWAERW